MALETQSGGIELPRLSKGEERRLRRSRAREAPDAASAAGAFFLRVTLGGTLLAFGVMNLLNPDAFAPLISLSGGDAWRIAAGVALTVGGLGMLTGFLDRFSAVVIAAFMIALIVVVHVPNLRVENVRPLAILDVSREAFVAACALVWAAVSRKSTRIRLPTVHTR